MDVSPRCRDAKLGCKKLWSLAKALFLSAGANGAILVGVAARL